MSHDYKPITLPVGRRIDHYTIEKTIGGGGFSIVYLAREEPTGAEVIVKEYMPRRSAIRDDDGTIRARDDNSDNFAKGRRLFFQEATTLATLKHPNIVNVTNFFRANGTVYMVMEYEQGINLQEYIKRHNGGLSEAFIRTVFPPLLDGLKLIHARGLLHLDIKPGNIYLRNGGKPLLLDFGAVHEMMQSRQDQMTQVVTPGFSPVEQLNPGGYMGPWTDVYAIGATMRACIEGNAPPPSTERQSVDTMKPAVAAFKKRYSYGLLAAIDWAMEVDPLARPQSVDQLLDALAKEGQAPGQEGESVLGRLASILSRNDR